MTMEKMVKAHEWTITQEEIDRPVTRKDGEPQH